jgi:hypothetical protein
LHKCRAHHHPQITSISLFPLCLYIYSYMLNHTVCTYVLYKVISCTETLNNTF